jgi:hypothetical protein
MDVGARVAPQSKKLSADIDYAMIVKIYGH